MTVAPVRLGRFGYRLTMMVAVLAGLTVAPALAQPPPGALQTAPAAQPQTPSSPAAETPTSPSTPQSAAAPPKSATPGPARRRLFDFSVPDFGSAPLRLDVARLDVVQAYAPPQRAPNTEHRMIVSPLATLDDWARRHIEAAAPGRDDSSAVFVIEDASLLVEKLRPRKGLLDALIREDSEKFTLRLAVTLQVRDRLGATQGGTSAEATAWRVVPESLKDTERAAMWHELLIAAMDNLVPAFEANARAYLTRFLK
jgi:hypothetical protein